MPPMLDALWSDVNLSLAVLGLPADADWLALCDPHVEDPKNRRRHLRPPAGWHTAYFGQRVRGELPTGLLGLVIPGTEAEIHAPTGLLIPGTPAVIFHVWRVRCWQDGAEAYAELHVDAGGVQEILGGTLADDTALDAARRALRYLRTLHPPTQRGHPRGSGRRFPTSQAYWDELAPIVWSLKHGEDATEAAVARQLSLAGHPADDRTVAKWAIRYWGSWEAFVQEVQQAFT